MSQFPEFSLAFSIGSLNEERIEAFGLYQFLRDKFIY